jgi:diguanylate cyclase (GGDEF)-like protein
MAQQWFIDTEAIRMPRLADFLTLHGVETALAALQLHLPDRQYDEKFHILQPHSLMLPDLHYYRIACSARNGSVAVAFMDIDKFKDFNTKYGEVAVDRDILPVFMSTIAAFIFGRGHAYRYGGDEYGLILPSVELDEAVSAVDHLRLRLQSTPYRGVDEHTSVSIGLCVVRPESFLTDYEAVQRAARAKNFAKANGRNCVATYAGELYRAEDLYAAAPA